MMRAAQRQGEPQSRLVRVAMHAAEQVFSKDNPEFVKALARMKRLPVGASATSADLIGALISRRSTPHAAIFEPAKLGHLLRAIGGYDGEPVIRGGLLLLAYTFLRPGEVRRLDGIDLAEHRIVIPSTA